MNIFWFRRDLRLEDNHGLFRALEKGNVRAIFIFDTNILSKLEDKDDRRLSFIHKSVSALRDKLRQANSDLQVFVGDPVKVFQKLSEVENIDAVYSNRDYEPYAIARDKDISNLLSGKAISFFQFKDQCILEQKEVVKDDATPYTVYTPYMRKWKKQLRDEDLQHFPSETLLSNFVKDKNFELPTIKSLGFVENLSYLPSKEIDLQIIDSYHEKRDFPAVNGTTRLSIHLRFGTISIRSLAKQARAHNEKYFNELIWRDFYMMILWNFPNVVKEAFNHKYRRIEWLHNEEHFEAWKEGKTGYPIVDAGMRELNETGFMHNRVRMVVASFFTKHLFLNWQLGEAYFARKLNDFELSSNNGGWQWAASTGVDAAPYFRIFNPELQTKRFDPKLEYIRKWVPELNEFHYPKPIVDHKFARERALSLFKTQLNKF